MQSRHLELSQVGIDFPTPKGPFTALTDVNLKIQKGEFISLIGHSGYGKSTVLNIVAGLHLSRSKVLTLKLQDFKTSQLDGTVDINLVKVLTQ